jgi:hypothetical protein
MDIEAYVEIEPVIFTEYGRMIPVHCRALLSCCPQEVSVYTEVRDNMDLRFNEGYIKNLQNNFAASLRYDFGKRRTCKGCGYPLTLKPLKIKWKETVDNRK